MGRVLLQAFLLSTLLVIGCTPDQPPSTAAPAGIPSGGRAWLGAYVYPSETELAEPCLQVFFLLPNAPAERAGLREGDKVLRVAGRAVSYLNDVYEALQTISAQNASFAVSVMREGQRLELSVPVEKSPTPTENTSLWTSFRKQRFEQDFQNAEAAKRAGDKASAFRGYASAVRVAMVEAEYTEPLTHLATAVAALNPPPAVPAEAQRLNQRAMARVQRADSQLENERAVWDFTGALAAAPWIADLHLNYAIARERMGYAEEAAIELRYYLVLNRRAPDAEKIRQKIYELSAMAEELKPWLAYTGTRSSPGRVYVVGFKGRDMTVALNGQELCSGRIQNGAFNGKCYFYFDNDAAKKCFGPRREYEAQGRVESNELRIESITNLNHSPTSCVINSETKGTMVRFLR